MNNQEILDNAPEGATHIDNCGFYLKAGKSGFMEPDNLSNDWDYEYSNHSEVSSLADIQRIVELENKNAKMLECLCDISDACIGQLTMSYSLDSEGIGQSIYEATGMTNPELNAALKEQVKT